MGLFTRRKDAQVLLTERQAAVQVLLAEYDRLKTEQVARIGVRDNLIYFMLGSAATVAAGAFAGRNAALALLLPVASMALGWTYLANDHMISAIGRHVRQQLCPRLRDLAGQQLPVFGWERNHADDHRRRSRKRLQFAVDLLTFAGPAVAATVAYWVIGPVTVALTVVAIAELVAVAVLAVQMAIYAQLR
ncbi:hypothetical protein Psi01_59180 [Planobispora siamensis]|uniref:Integral membrane protein n=2 Tax=Planobispora siamensis TaxID=936338 RepID=A0A8J3SJ16_9ACTN|nr:hypothetical protein Psi01_59180 [Planobispora siamensis]